MHPWALQVAWLPSGLGAQNPCFGKLLDPRIPEAGYMGLTANSFKVRYGNHKTSFKYSEKESTPASLGLCGASRMATTITWRALATCPDCNPSNNPAGCA